MLITTSTIARQGSRDYNEDAHGDAELMAGRCIVVADGAGGHRGGAVASRIVIDSILLNLASVAAWTEEAMTAAIDAAGAAVRERQQQESLLREMSSTVALLCIDASSATARCAHLGDTRILLFRGFDALQLTRDHSVLQSLKDAGLIDASGGTARVDRTTLYAAVGAEGDIRPVVSGPIDLEEGDAFVVCTDGTWDTLSAEAMIAELQASTDVEEWVARMAGAVERAAKPNQDNFTIAGIWLGTRDQTTIRRDSGCESSTV